MNLMYATLKKWPPVSIHKLLLLIFDVLNIVGAFYASYNLRNYFFAARGGNYDAWAGHLLFLAVVIVFAILYFRNFSLYTGLGLRYSHGHLATLAQAWFVAGLVFIVLAFFFDVLIIIEHRITAAIFLAIGFAGLAMSRFAVVPALANFVASRWLLNQNIVIIGAGERGRYLASHLRKADYMHTRIVGFIDDDRKKLRTDFNGIPILGPINRLKDIVDHHNIHEVFIAMPNIDPKKLILLLGELKALPVKARIVREPFQTVFETAPSVPIVNDLGLISINKSRLLWADRAVKWSMDWVGSLVGLVLLSPIFVLIGLLIKMESPGPGLFPTRTYRLTG